MEVALGTHQIKAVRELKNGSILNGDVGSGKSRAAIYYWFTRVCGGQIKVNGKGKTGPMSSAKDLYIITTKKKREDKEWLDELAPFCIGETRELSFGYVQVTVDSWNNILKYADVENAFFIFDEQRLVGSGAWVKAFQKIAKKNQWIILSGTPGDVWVDYVPVFVAHGFYKNKSDFAEKHIVWSRYSKFPKIEKYYNTERLQKLRQEVLVQMPLVRHTRRQVQIIPTSFDKSQMDRLIKERWHIWEERPIRDVAELFHAMRKLVNTDPSKFEKLNELLAKHPRLIIFYNFNYELDLLREWSNGLTNCQTAEWNGQKHEPLPVGDSWIYLVQYTAGSEGWNCVTTDTTVFFSLTYSYKQYEQSQGRIDRMNTPYTDLHYYILRSSAGIDLSIWKALLQKKNFNESAYQF